MLSITTLGQFHNEISEDGALENLKPIVKQLCQHNFRRIDRFIQLALIGSHQCCLDRPLPVNTGLYLASGKGPMGSTIELQQQLVLKRSIPKPANFINTQSNTAGYYVARNLNLENLNLFISRGAASLEASLELAEVDINSGAVDAALVGQVEEVTLPLKNHRLRIGLAEGLPTCEGSYWFLLEKNKENKKSCGNILINEVFYSDDELNQALKALEKIVSHVYLNHGLKEVQANYQQLSLPTHWEYYTPELGFHAARTAAMIQKYLNDINNNETIGKGLACVQTLDGNLRHLLCVSPA